MDLKIKDVAELLNVSEATIQRWLEEGKIPSYQIDNQHRFARTEIEAWMMSQRFELEQGFHEKEKTETSAKGGSQQFSLFRAINKGGVYLNIPGKRKEEVIRNTMKLLAPEIHLDEEVLTDLLLDREKLQSTALANGIAVPHPREMLPNLTKDVIGVAFLQNPIPYEALDGEPVHTLFFLFASQDKRHLHLLAKIAHLSSQPKAIAFFKTKPSKERMLEFVKEWESKISQPES